MSENVLPMFSSGSFMVTLEHTLALTNNIVKGEFIISGDYKVNEKSNVVDPFSLNLPFEIVIDERFDTTKSVIDIDDFYYEIVNDNVLRVAIDVLVDKLEEKLIEDDFELVEEVCKKHTLDIEEDRGIKKEEIVEKLEQKEEKNEQIESKKEEIRCIDTSDNFNSLFNQISKENEEYVTYNVFIVREGDTLESILEKYNIDIEELKKYNDLSELKLGDKLIIPNSYERD